MWKEVGKCLELVSRKVGPSGPSSYLYEVKIKRAVTSKGSTGEIKRSLRVSFSLKNISQQIVGSMEYSSYIKL